MYNYSIAPTLDLHLTQYIRLSYACSTKQNLITAETSEDKNQTAAEEV